MTCPSPDAAALERIVVSNEDILMEILPAAGGRMVRLLDRPAGHDWLWSNPHLAPRAPVYGQSYVKELDAGGWDEILPSVDPCRVPTTGGVVSIPDHGDLVQTAWKVISAGEAHLEMEAVGQSLPFLFRRRLELRGRHVAWDYRLENRGTFAFPWLWCAHPLLPFDAGTEVETTAVFHVLYATGAAVSLQSRTIRWEELPSRGAPWAAKLFSARGVTDRMVVRQRRGVSFELAWNAEETPCLGLWVNNGGWSGCGSAPYHNLGVEPSTLPIDDLSAAEKPPFLAPGESRRWSLRLHLHS